MNISSKAIETIVGALVLLIAGNEDSTTNTARALGKECIYTVG